MLGETFNPKPKQASGPKQSGQTVSNPRALLAIALKNATANNAMLGSSSLAQAINNRRKKK